MTAAGAAAAAAALPLAAEAGAAGAGGLSRIMTKRGDVIAVQYVTPASAEEAAPLDITSAFEHQLAAPAAADPRQSTTSTSEKATNARLAAAIAERSAVYKTTQI